MQDVGVIVPEEGARVYKTMRWGLIPFWAKDEKIGYGRGRSSCGSDHLCSEGIPIPSFLGTTASASLLRCDRLRAQANFAKSMHTS